MVSKELHVPSQVLMCEASILPYASIHRSAWNRYSAKFVLTEFSEVRLKGCDKGDEPAIVPSVT
jgi:hypothetical protein